MSNQEILLKILEELNIGNAEFQSSIITGQMVSGVIYAAFYFILMIVLIKFIKKFNEDFYIKENLDDIFKKLKNVVDKRNQNVEPDYERYSDFDYRNASFSDYIKQIKIFLQNRNFTAKLITLILVYLEIKYVFRCVMLLLSNVVIALSCYLAPEKVILDYLSDLF